MPGAAKSLLASPAESGLNAAVGAFIPLVVRSRERPTLAPPDATPPVSFEPGCHRGRMECIYVGRYQEDQCRSNPRVYRRRGVRVLAGLFAVRRHHVGLRSV